MKQTAVHWSIGLTSHVPCVFSRNHWPWSTLWRQARLRLSTPCAKAPWFEVIGCEQSKLKKVSVSFWRAPRIIFGAWFGSSQYGLLLKARVPHNSVLPFRLRTWAHTICWFSPSMKESFGETVYIFSFRISNGGFSICGAIGPQGPRSLLLDWQWNRHHSTVPKSQWLVGRFYSEFSVFCLVATWCLPFLY